MGIQRRAADPPVSDFQREVAKLPTVTERYGEETAMCPHCDVRTYHAYPHVRGCLKCGRAYRAIVQLPEPLDTPG